MALVLADRVQQTGTANTTVSFTLSGTVTGFQSFAVVGNGNTTYYSAFDPSGNWEVGVGTYSTTGPTLTRTTVVASSNSGSAVTFSGTVNVFLTYPAEYAAWSSNNPGTSGHVLTSNGVGVAPSWQAGGVGTITVTDFTATASQTTFTVSYTVGLVEVYQNGAKLGIADYTATNGTSIVLAVGATAGDLIEVVAFSSLNLTTAVNSISFGSTGLTPSSPTAGTITVAGTLAVANGGSGQTTAQAAMNTFAGAVTSGSYLRGNGTNVVMSTIQAADVPTLNQNTTGSAGSVANALTAGTNITFSSGTTYNGSAAITINAATQGATVTGTTTAGTYYVVGTTSTSGILSTASISNTNAVSYNASTGALTAVSMSSSSDERLKSNIQTITNALQTVENLRGVSYLRNDKPEIGVVAQEVEKVLPMVVQEDPEGYKSVTYGNMVGLLIEAVKELSAEVKALKAELNK